MEKDYKNKMSKELARYDMSVKAFLLGYQSWYIGQYIKSLRIVNWTNTHPTLLNKLWGGVNKFIMRKISHKNKPCNC